jgi:hypothetical protein
MATRTKVTIGLGIAGILIIVPGAMWFSSRRLSNDDLGLAFRPLLRIRLTQVEQERSVSAEVSVPDGLQWRQIRHYMGDAPLLLAASGPRDRESLYCPDQLGIQLKVATGSSPVSPEKPFTPYGFSLECLGSIGIQFRASPGTKVTAYVTATNQKPLPSGNVILINNWYDAKDKIVGVMLDEDFRKVFVVTSIIGAVLILFSAYLAFCPKHPPRQG